MAVRAYVYMYVWMRRYSHSHNEIYVCEKGTTNRRSELINHYSFGATAGGTQKTNGFSHGGQSERAHTSTCIFCFGRTTTLHAEQTATHTLAPMHTTAIRTHRASPYTWIETHTHSHTYTYTDKMDVLFSISFTSTSQCTTYSITVCMCNARVCVYLWERESVWPTNSASVLLISFFFLFSVVWLELYAATRSRSSQF